MNEVLIEVLLGALHLRPDRLDRRLLAEFAHEEWELLIELASVQRVRPLLYRNLRQRGWLDSAPPHVRTQLQAAYQSTAMRSMRYQHEVAGICQDLQDEGIPVMALKGLYLVSAVYANAGLREMNDVDILVPYAGLARAVEVLHVHGYRAVRPFSIEFYRSTMHHLPPFVKEGKLCIELHWNITQPDQATSIDEKDLWGHAVAAQIGAASMHALGHEDFILHLCQHASYHHRFEMGLRPSCDLAMTIARFEPHIDWDFLCRRATTWGWQRGVHLALRLAQDCVGANVPAPVLATLEPPGFDDQLIHTARALIMTDRGFSKSFSPHVNRMWKRTTLASRLQVVWERIFVSRRQLALIYGLPIESPRLPLYYFVRLKDIISKTVGQMLQLWRGEEAETLLGDHRERMRVWLFDGE